MSSGVRVMRENTLQLPELWGGRSVEREVTTEEDRLEDGVQRRL